MTILHFVIRTSRSRDEVSSSDRIRSWPLGVWNLWTSNEQKTVESSTGIVLVEWRNLPNRKNTKEEGKANGVVITGPGMPTNGINKLLSSYLLKASGAGLSATCKRINLKVRQTKKNPWKKPNNKRQRVSHLCNESILASNYDCY